MTDTEPAATSGNEVAAQAAYDHELHRWSRRVAKAQATADGKTALSVANEREQAADDARDQRKAESYRARLVDPGRALARAWRTYRLVLALLGGAIVLVLAWNARRVAIGLGGPNPPIADYAAEAAFSVPLVVVLILQVTAAQNGRLEQVKPLRATASGFRVPTATGLLEAALLAGSVLVCTWPALSAPHPRFEEIATSALPPFSLVAACGLMYTTTELFSSIFRDYRKAADDGDNMRRRLELAMDLALDVERAQQGDNPLPTSDDGLPSISQIGKRFKGEKATHQVAHDILARFSARREVPAQQTSQ